MEIFIVFPYLVFITGLWISKTADEFSVCHRFFIIGWFYSHK